MRVYMSWYRANNCTSWGNKTTLFCKSPTKNSSNVTGFVKVIFMFEHRTCSNRLSCCWIVIVLCPFWLMGLLLIDLRPVKTSKYWLGLLTLPGSWLNILNKLIGVVDMSLVVMKQSKSQMERNHSCYCLAFMYSHLICWWLTMNAEQGRSSEYHKCWVGMSDAIHTFKHLHSWVDLVVIK